MHHSEPSGKWACRYCAHWTRRELAPGRQSEDCTQGRLMRQPTCRGFEREPGSDDDLESPIAPASASVRRFKP